MAFLSLSFASTVALLISVPLAAASASKCRCFPGDPCWPTPQEWSTFNTSLGGKLVATVPLGAPCHDSPYAAYNETTCQQLQKAWTTPETHWRSSSSVGEPWFANQSCDPFLPRESQCVIGTYIQYAVNVSEASDISATIKFATERNIRFVVRNTGHDYIGKSTGAGALGVWTHFLKDIVIKDYSGPHYTGKAIKMEAGVQGFEAYAAANAQGLQVVGGECPTVGLAGGYTQGGGHSALASRHGLAADQTLEWELVTATGEHLIANRQQNTDLFWALSGGGGGTYGVVLSLTSKAHPDVPTVGFNLSLARTNVSDDVYYDIVSLYHATAPSLVDAGGMCLGGVTNESFTMFYTAPGIPQDKVAELVKPVTDKLNGLGVTYKSHIETFPGYLQEFNAMMFPVAAGFANFGGRLLPRSLVEQNNAALTKAIRYIVDHGNASFGSVALSVSKKVAGDVSNAVLPAWRTALLDSYITTPWDYHAPLSQMEADQYKIVNDLLPKLEALTPNGGCYLNEGSFRQPDWQNVFYGSNYEKLRAIKKRYDPNDLFYGTTAVGSEVWTRQPDGRLCRT